MFGKKKTWVRVSPRYCPGCELDEFDTFEGSSCPECGDSLRAKGYCPVCERYLALDPGEPCPKHDIKLERSPEPTPAYEGPYVPWVTVSVLSNTASAAIVRGRLEAEGIPTFLDGERMGTAGMHLAATTGIRLQVPPDKVADARIILSQNWSLPLDEKADFEDLL
jgi:hypothetical protein